MPVWCILAKEQGRLFTSYKRFRIQNSWFRVGDCFNLARLHIFCDVRYQGDAGVNSDHMTVEDCNKTHCFSHEVSSTEECAPHQECARCSHGVVLTPLKCVCSAAMTQKTTASWRGAQSWLQSSRCCGGHAARWRIYRLSRSDQTPACFLWHGCHCKPSETLLVRLFTRTGRRSCSLIREPGNGRTCHSIGVPDSDLVCDSVLLKSRWCKVDKLLTRESQRAVLQKHSERMQVAVLR